MDFSISSEQKAYQRSIIEFATEELNDRVFEKDLNAEFPYENWYKCGDMGYLGLPIPEIYGGQGANLLTTILCMEALALSCKDNGLVHAIVTQLCCAAQIMLFGSNEQKEKFLPDIASGKKITAQALTEPDAGSDLGAMLTLAEKKDSGYLLNGSKMYISNGPIADLITIFAVTDPKRKTFGGVSCFLLERSMDGLKAENSLDKMGLRTLQNGELILQDCAVNYDHLLGKVGQGMFIFNEVIEWERILMGACHIGVLNRIYNVSIAYAKSRKQFGQAISKFQAVSNKITDMRICLELGRLMVQKAAWMKDQNKKATLEASIAKLYVSENLKKSCIEAIQLHGAYGFMREAELERELRDSIAATIYSGTSEIQHNIIAKFSGI